ncbi:MAG: (Fe-S)-binding protein [Saprospiraceae bacterium]|nr:(Fe-S)-binding protein [Saprospiraceae bacterium]
MSFQQILFVFVGLFATSLAVYNFNRIWKNIHLGSDYQVTGSASERWKNVFLIALGQKKMFARPIAAVFHMFIYIAFIITQIELIEIGIDGLFGQHRFFAPYLGSFYTFVISLIEVLSLLAFIATIVFLFRRNVLKIARFQKQELNDWPRMDANIILMLEIMLIIAIFSMNSADIVLQHKLPEHYHHTGNFVISSVLGPMFLSGMKIPALIAMERIGWWMHFSVVLAFLNYLPFSKHLHILLAFPNTYYGKLTPVGEMENMPEVMNEVKTMMGIPTDAPANQDANADFPVFGANDVTNLTWKTLLEAYTCTECGRCTSVCPANITGKKLSPRKIMMDIRDRAEEVGYKISANEKQFIKKDCKDDKLSKHNFDDGRSLFDYISKEEIHACTTCNACVEACPVLISPVDAILQLRRYEILTLSEGPAEWIPMFTAIENNGAVWQISTPRDAWTSEVNV